MSDTLTHKAVIGVGVGPPAVQPLFYNGGAACFVPDLFAQQQTLNEAEKQRRAEQEILRQRAVQTGD